ncbi:MAG: LysR family transcriptional regulator [Saprospiraceae bacterium]|nr:LysR family transcriptional regulator [Saprospiraceae bacterium]
MTLQQLRYILALDRERHFAKAAQVCLVSQPALTIQVKKMEEEMGVLIFDRSKVPLKPTPSGKEIIKRAKIVLQEIEGIKEFVVDTKNKLQGKIILGVVSTLSPYLIPLVIENLIKKTPKIEYVIKEYSTIELMENLENGEIDIALMSTPTANKKLKEFPVFSEPFVAYLNPDHSKIDAPYYEISKSDISNLLLLENEYCYNAQLLNICNIKSTNPIHRKVNFEITSIETLKNLTRGSTGIAILPELSVIHQKEEKFVKQFKPPIPVREVGLVVSKRFNKKLLLEKMSEAISDSLPDKLKSHKEFRKVRWDDSPYFRKAL